MTITNIIYRFGSYPSGFLFICSALALVYCHFVRFLPRLRLWLTYIVLTLAIGPGLLVNIALKDGVGRPRPYATSEFGGRHEFTPLFKITGLDQESFPSGHAAAGFLFSVFFFLLYPRRPRLALAALGFSLLAGGVLSFTRVSQGGHFLSDTLWSMGLINLTNAFMYFKLLKVPRRERRWEAERSPDETVFRPRPLTGYGIIGGVIALSITVYLFTRDQIHEEWQTIDLTPGVETLTVIGDFEQERVFIRYGQDKARVLVHYDTNNLGLPGSSFKPRWRLEKNDTDKGATLTLWIERRMPQWDREGEVTLILPHDTPTFLNLSAFALPPSED